MIPSMNELKEKLGQAWNDLQVDAALEAFWVRTEAHVPNAKKLHHHAEARGKIEAILLAFAFSAMLEVGDFSRADLVGNARVTGLTGSLRKLVSDFEETDWEMARLRISMLRVKDIELREAVSRLDRKHLAVSRAMADLKEEISAFEQAIPVQVGGRGPMTSQKRLSDARLIAMHAARAWRTVDLPLGGPGRNDDGFAEFLRALHFECTQKPNIPNEATVLAEVRESLPSPKFR